MSHFFRMAWLTAPFSALQLLTLAISGAPPVPARNLDRVDKVFTNGATAWVIRGIAVP